GDVHCSPCGNGSSPVFRRIFSVRSRSLQRMPESRIAMTTSPRPSVVVHAPSAFRPLPWSGGEFWLPSVLASCALRGVKPYSGHCSLLKEHPLFGAGLPGAWGGASPQTSYAGSLGKPDPLPAVTPTATIAATIRRGFS